MVIIAVLITVIVVAATGAAIAISIMRAERRAAAAERAADRAATLDAAQQAFVIERQQTVQTAVDTVLAVAGEKFADHTSAASHELDVRNTAITKQFDTVSGELQQMRQLVEQLQRDRAEQQGRLERGLQQAVQASTTLNQTTQSLKEALASSKARGQWGERLADDVLRTAGFVEGVNYRKQTGIATGGIPDFTFLLPHGRVLHMDVKFPLDNYLRVLEATADTDRAGYERAFLKDVRQRIKEIATRAYDESDEALDAVLLFIPNESIYSFIHEHDTQLVDVALAQKVVLCSPFTLFSVLAVIRQAVDAFMVERTSDQILQCLGGFSAQWHKFSESVDAVGRRFESAQKAYEELAGVRRRQLQKHLDRVDSLRAERGIGVAPIGAAPDEQSVLSAQAEPGPTNGSSQGGCTYPLTSLASFSDMDDDDRPALRAVPEG
jgi:DNA recombination protein RmuC